jgi:hypothetical protein
MGQVVLEWRRLIPDPLAVLTFVHASSGHPGCEQNGGRAETNNLLIKFDQFCGRCG